MSTVIYATIAIAYDAKERLLWNKIYFLLKSIFWNWLWKFVCLKFHTSQYKTVTSFRLLGNQSISSMHSLAAQSKINQETKSLLSLHYNDVTKIFFLHEYSVNRNKHLAMTSSILQFPFLLDKSRANVRYF